MIKSKSTTSITPIKGRKSIGKTERIKRYRRLGSMGKASINLITDIYNPLDSINRFINLALDTMGDGSTSRQFLLDSKEGIRETSKLLRKLDDYSRKMAKEFKEIVDNEQE